MNKHQQLASIFLCVLNMAVAVNAHANNDGTLAILTASALIIGQAASGNNESNSEANGLSFVPSIALQNKTLSFDQRYSGAATNTAKFSEDLPVLSTSLTASHRKVFLTLKYEQSLGDPSTAVRETQAAALNSNLITIPGLETRVEREDMSITLGYNVWSKLNLFVGHMEGQTTLTPSPGCKILSPPTNPPTNCSNNFGPTNRAFVHNYLGGSNYEQKYTEEGPYIGLSYAWSVADAGVLSASFAYADMNGKYTDNMAPDVTNFFGGTVERFEYSGDTTGTSLGLTWTAPLGDTSSYFIDVRKQSYKMSGEDDTGEPIYTGVHLTTEETMKGITAGVQVFF